LNNWLEARRYVAPLREGGSLPAIVDTEPPGQYVVKFRGAGQGPKALVAEFIAARIAERLGLPVPAPAIVTLAEGFGLGEPDPEIQDVLRGSVGANFGLAYLPGALGFDAAVDQPCVSPDLAADVVWFDAFLTNPDRTHHNPNLLVWEKQVWLIDHGASLYFHHRWDGWERKARGDFPLIRDHILLPRAGDLKAADARQASRLDEPVIRGVVAAIPDEWIVLEAPFPDVTAQREAYTTYLLERLREPRAWVAKAIDARRVT
jgi:hypothetical protein